jgi:hypothetical protein
MGYLIGGRTLAGLKIAIFTADYEKTRISNFNLLSGSILFGMPKGTSALQLS